MILQSWNKAYWFVRGSHNTNHVVSWSSNAADPHLSSNPGIEYVQNARNVEQLRMYGTKLPLC